MDSNPTRWGQLPHYFIGGRQEDRVKGETRNPPGDLERLLRDTKVKFHESVRRRKAKWTRECAGGVLTPGLSDAEDGLEREGLGPVPAAPIRSRLLTLQVSVRPVSKRRLLPTPHPGTIRGDAEHERQGPAGTERELGKRQLWTMFYCDRPVRGVLPLPRPHWVWALAPLRRGGERHPLPPGVLATTRSPRHIVQQGLGKQETPDAGKLETV